MTVVSDTIYYREDGTVSSVQRTTRHRFIKPSGAEDDELMTEAVPLSALSAHLDGAYADMDAHNKALEKQIVNERESAEADKEALANDLNNQLNALRTAIKEADVAWSARLEGLI